ncbi:MAG: hypothetical protein HXX10_08090 [Rhodoplanes sp.]|uniref:hypothetical protein n=1 Tax=Rhodoplanes sp. TaxID=1968906 RepID=UPI0017EEE577|nr:hypothetical protein [Rhodoplanes sp.]NVO13982.1 hypothetical protein [Rhodoplanes sp.]
MLSLHALAKPLLACLVRVRELLLGAPDDRYQPERHYMRGPGPKWREKYGRVAETAR